MSSLEEAEDDENNEDDEDDFYLNLYLYLGADCIGPSYYQVVWLIWLLVSKVDTD